MSVPSAAVPAASHVPPALDERPPGERYYRHPGDVVRLVVWAVVMVVALLLVEVAESTNAGLRDDMGDAAALLPRAVRQLALAGAQVTVLLGAVVVAVGLAGRRRWRRLLVLAASAAAGAAAYAALDRASGFAGPVSTALRSDSWLISTRFPTPAVLASAAAATVVGGPWLSGPWRRAAARWLVALGVTMLIAGTAGPGELVLAGAVGATVGSLLLVAVGAPNRRPSPSAVAAAFERSGLPITSLRLERATGGRAQLYRAATADGTGAFVKVYAVDSRDADRLYRGWRALVLRDAGDDLAATLEQGVEHESLLLLLARRAGVRAPDLRAVASLPDGSMAIAMEELHGESLDRLGVAALDAAILDGVWRQVRALHAAGVAHGSLRPANIVVAGGTPVIVDLSAGRAPAPPRSQAIDRAELLVGLAVMVGPATAVASAARVLPADDLAAAVPYLQPLALSAATRRQTGKSLLAAVRDEVATVTGREPEPLERLVRVRARTIVMIATLAGAFYFLLPQLANVDDSVRALRSANWAWLAGTVVLSGTTYVAAAVAMRGGVSVPMPLGPTVLAQAGSSFVNRVTPANVGGMALNVRYLQKAGVPPADAVTGMGLNVLAGGIVHIVLLIVFFAWAGRRGDTSFAVPASSTILVVVVVVLAVAGLALATGKGRRLLRGKVLPTVRQSAASIGALGRSPRRLVALFGGSMGVTLAYILALTCAANAFAAGVGLAQVGAVYLGSALIAAAAPTPGGLGAMEAALVAAFTAVGVDPAIAVATVLSYRLATYWLPILPGWLAFRQLERRSYI